MLFVAAAMQLSTAKGQFKGKLKESSKGIKGKFKGGSNGSLKKLNRDFKESSKEFKGKYKHNTKNKFVVNQKKKKKTKQ